MQGVSEYPHDDYGNGNPIHPLPPKEDPDVPETNEYGSME